ncbi:MAG: hypothetical protein HC850_13580 [Rhodomicrobium sp.]|nr:hypothetical protein [Rhodomicrobium sp.]
MLADRIAAAISLPPAAAREMAEAARQHATARFSKAMLQRETLRAYDDLLNSELLTTYMRNSIKIEDFQPLLSRIPT